VIASHLGDRIAQKPPFGAATMRPYVKLLWLLVIVVVILSAYWSRITKVS